MRNVCLSLAVLICCGLSSAASAAIITSLGLDVDRGQTWRSTNDPKPSAFDPNGDNAYGSDGYYVYGQPNGTPVLFSGGGGPPLISSLPSYIASVTTDPAVSTAYDSSYPALDDPSQPIGPNVANMTDITPDTVTHNGTGFAYFPGSHSYFTITLASSADFVLTVLLDTDNNGFPVHEVVEVDGPGGSSNTIDEPASDRNADPDYAFFEISGNTGDVFIVSILEPDESARTETTGLGFEHVPEPASLSLLGVGGLLMLRRRRA